jgi:hypothetical protein
MLKTVTNFNYVLGFIIVIILIYISIITLISRKSERYKLTNEFIISKKGITVFTKEGAINLDSLMLDHYLNRIKDNLEYLSKHIDSDKCEIIKKQLTDARASLHDQIVKTSELADLNQQSELQEEIGKLKERVGSMSNVMFSNEQNPDTSASIIIEMIIDMETLIYLVKMIPNEIKSIDLRDIDQISNIMHKQSCVPNNPEPQANEDIKEIEFPSETSPGDEMFIANPKHRPGSFETFADFNKHQNLSDENNISHRPNNMSYSLRKKKLNNIRKTSMLLGGEIKKENHKSLHTQKRETKKLREQHKDPIRDRFTNAQETFISAHPNRYRKTKSSLLDDNNDIEDNLLLPKIEFN